MEKHEVCLELVKCGELCAKVFCTAKAAKYLMIGFGLEPRPIAGSVSDSLELLPDGDIRKVTARGKVKKTVEE